MGVKIGMGAGCSGRLSVGTNSGTIGEITVAKLLALLLWFCVCERVSTAARIGVFSANVAATSGVVALWERVVAIEACVRAETAVGV